MFESTEAWLKFDREHIWHPYTSMSEPLPVYPVVGARGVKLELADGRQLVDGMSSWWCAIHGYNVPELNAAIRTQTEQMAHVMFGGITHEPAVRLSKQLIEMTPEPLQHVFLADSGSISMEVAIKMALQYQRSIGQAQRQRLVAHMGGYHGDTFGAMSVCDPVKGMHHVFRDVLPQHHFVPRPAPAWGQEWNPAALQPLSELLEREGETIAAVCVEPVVQGAGGMYFYHPQYLRGVRELCDAHGVLLIFDEIATGFGRTGKLFAAEHAGVSPDIMAVGKALTGGYMTMAATLATRQVAYGISAGEPGVFMHGPTFMGNPLAASVASASLSLLSSGAWKQQTQDLERWLAEELGELVDDPAVDDVRTLGAIGVVETKEPLDVAALQRIFVEEGAWIRPFRSLIYVMPAFVMSREEVAVLGRAIRAGVRSLR